METQILVGNVGKDPEMRFTPEGKAVCNFPLACYAGKDKEGNKQTVWTDITLWSAKAELANELVKKGMMLRIAGYPGNPRIWKTKDKKLYLDDEGNPKVTATMTAFSFMQVERTTTYEEVPLEPVEVK